MFDEFVILLFLHPQLNIRRSQIALTLLYSPLQHFYSLVGDFEIHRAVGGYVDHGFAWGVVVGVHLASEVDATDFFIRSLTSSAPFSWSFFDRLHRDPENIYSAISLLEESFIRA